MPPRSRFRGHPARAPGRPRPRRTDRPTRDGAPRALTSDAWYTLLYISEAERRRLTETRRRLWGEPLRRAGVGRARIRELFDRRLRWAAALEAAGRTPTVPEQIAQLQRWAGGRLRLDHLPDALDRALLRTEVRPAPGAVAAVRLLADRSVPLGIVSNVLNESGVAARTVLERLGLLTSFRVVVLSCEQPRAKPAAEPFRLACRFLGVPPADTAHLGDLDYDVRGARSAGARAWWYTGLRRLNGYLPAQVDPRTVPAPDTVRRWSEVPRRFAEDPRPSVP